MESSDRINTALNTAEIRAKAIKSVKWSSFGELLSRTVSPLITLILARILTPSDFGVLGVATITIGVMQSIQTFGLGAAIIQREKELKKAANVMFWVNLVLSLLAYCLILLFAPFIGQFFHDNSVINVLRVLCLQLPLYALCSIHFSLLQRKFSFKQLSFVKFGIALIPGLVSIPLALSGKGVWALVWGYLAGSVYQVLILWKISPWRPTFDFDKKIAKELLNFGFWVLSELLLGMLIVWGDSIILGHFMGIKDLGIYRLGFSFVMFAFGLFFNPLCPILYSTFARLQSSLEQLKKTFLNANQVIATISIPMGVGLALCAGTISQAVFGEKWKGVELVILSLGIMNGFAWLVGINSDVYRAIGRPDVNTKLQVLTAVYYIPVYIIAAPYGLFVFCMARIGVAVIALFLHIYFAHRYLGLSFTYLGKCVKSPLLASLIMGLVILIFINFSEDRNIWFKACGVVGLGVISYMLALCAVERELINKIFGLVKETLKLSYERPVSA